MLVPTIIWCDKFTNGQIIIGISIINIFSCVYCLLIVDSIWNNRNKMKFEGESLTLGQLIFMIKEMIQYHVGRMLSQRDQSNKAIIIGEWMHRQKILNFPALSMGVTKKTCVFSYFYGVLMVADFGSRHAGSPSRVKLMRWCPITIFTDYNAFAHGLCLIISSLPAIDRLKLICITKDNILIRWCDRLSNN